MLECISRLTKEKVYGMFKQKNEESGRYNDKTSGEERGKVEKEKRWIIVS